MEVKQDRDTGLEGAPKTMHTVARTGWMPGFRPVQPTGLDPPERRGEKRPAAGDSPRHGDCKISRISTGYYPGTCDKEPRSCDIPRKFGQISRPSGDPNLRHFAEESPPRGENSHVDGTCNDYSKRSKSEFGLQGQHSQMDSNTNSSRPSSSDCVVDYSLKSNENARQRLDCLMHTQKREYFPGSPSFQLNNTKYQHSGQDPSLCDVNPKIHNGKSQSYSKDSQAYNGESMPCTEESLSYIGETLPCIAESKPYEEDVQSYTGEVHPYQKRSPLYNKTFQPSSMGSPSGSDESQPYDGEFQPNDGESRPKNRQSLPNNGESRPCGVCEAPTWGMYYGAVVCLPCKTFFSRYHQNYGRYICHQDNKCHIQHANRVSCKACRLNKCVEVGMNRIERPDKCIAKAGEKLCAVCGDFANGIHFGVFTCEGCKKFFLRGLKEHTMYVCKKGGQCRVTPRTRNVCRLCRYQRCQDVGMSREAIKYGRRKKTDGTSSSGEEFDEDMDDTLSLDHDRMSIETTSTGYSTRTSSDINIQQTQGGSDIDNNMDARGVRETAPSSSSCCSPDSSYKSMEEEKNIQRVSQSPNIIKTECETKPTDLKASLSPNLFPNALNDPHVVPDIEIIPVVKIDLYEPEKTPEGPEKQLDSSLEKESFKKKQDGGRLPLGDTKFNVDRWVQKYWNHFSAPAHHMQMVPEVTYYWVTSVPSTVRKLVSTDHHLLAALGRLHLTQRRHCQWLQTHTLQQFLGKIDSNTVIKDIEDFVIFAKALPGFDTINASDQYTLIRRGAVECRFFTSAVYEGLDRDSGDWALVDKGTTLCHQQELFFAEARKVFCLFLAEQLDQTEHDLLLAICLLAIDRPGLRDPARITELRERYIGVLAAYTLDKYGEAVCRLTRLFSLMPLTRLLGRWHDCLLQDVRCSVDGALLPKISEPVPETGEAL